MTLTNKQIVKLYSQKVALQYLMPYSKYVQPSAKILPTYRFEPLMYLRTTTLLLLHTRICSCGLYFKALHYIFYTPLYKVKGFVAKRRESVDLQRSLESLTVSNLQCRRENFITIAFCTRTKYTSEPRLCQHCECTYK